MPKRKFAKTGKTVFSSKRRRVSAPRPLAPPRTGGFWGVTKRSGQERKFLDTPVTEDFTTTGFVSPLNLIATGTDFTNRIGRKVCMKSFQLRCFIGLESLSNPSGYRHILVYDKQTNGNTPAVTDILDNSVGGSLFNAMINLNNRDRFVILWDKTSSLNQAGMNFIAYKKYKKLNHETVYSGTTAAIGSIATGGLFLVTLGSVAAGAADIDQVCTCRIRFVDA